jgi:hypothetical protein
MTLIIITVIKLNIRNNAINLHLCYEVAKIRTGG